MPIRKLLILTVLFISAFVAAIVMKPSTYISITSNINLNDSIPIAFGDWKVIDQNKLQVVNPKEDSLESKIYTNVFEKSFINSKNQVVMLSIAYGDEQRDDMLVHFPDVCYPAQGFNIDHSKSKSLNIHGMMLPVKFLETQKGPRKEDVTYWVRVGEKIVASRKEQKIESIKYGLKGIIPDGLIFRVSTIKPIDGQLLHKDFIESLLNSLDSKTYQFLLGSKKSGF